MPCAPTPRPCISRTLALSVLAVATAACSDFHLFGRGADDNDPGSANPAQSCDCPLGFDPLPDSSACVAELEEPATFQGESAPVCAIAPYFAYGMYGVRWPGGSNDRSEYWGQSDDIPNGRLNEVGVWTCDASGRAGSDPVEEWTGFAVCVDLDEPGMYMVGLGADNRMRLDVDGQLIHEDTDDHTRNFNYWWINLVELAAGRHIFEVHGYNAGSLAAFGAEIAGPFPPDSPTDDASLSALDYDSNIAWSTDDAIGQAFMLGESAGWSCPDGSAFDPCAEDPVCVRFEYDDCQNAQGVGG